MKPAQFAEATVAETPSDASRLRIRPSHSKLCELSTRSRPFIRDEVSAPVASANCTGSIRVVQAVRPNHDLAHRRECAEFLARKQLAEAFLHQFSSKLGGTRILFAAIDIFKNFCKER